MAMEKEGVFNLQDFLDNDPEYSQYGAKVVDMSPEGVPVVKTAKGEEFEVNPADIISARGQTADKWDVEINTPDTAIPKSPVALLDRLKLTTSTPARSLPYLKSKFDDAIVHPDKGVLVKQGGTWAQVDPDYLGTGTPWEKTRELAADVVDTADEVAAGLVEGGAAAIAGTLGTLAMGPVGGYIASIPAAGAANKPLTKARFRLGRMLGTYTATPEEQLQDEFLEMAYAMAGQAAAPVVGGAVKGVVGLGKGIAQLPKAIVQLQAKVLGTEAENLYRVVDRPQAVETAIKKGWGLARARGGASVNSSSAQQALLDMQQKEVATAMELGSKKLPAMWRQAIDETAAVVEQSGKVLDVDFSTLKNDLITAFTQGERPAAKLVTQGKGAAARQILAPLAEGEALAKNGVTLLNADQFSRTLRRIDALDQLGQKSGAEAVSELARVQKSLTEALNYAADSATKNPAEMQKIATLSETIRQSIDGLISKHSPEAAAAWAEKSAVYKKYADAVNWGRNILSDSTGRGLETFTKQLASRTPGRGSAAKKAFAEGGLPGDEAGSIIELLGDQGKQIYDNIMDMEAARALAPIAPRISLPGALIAANVVPAPLDPVTKTAIGAVLSGASSPALVRKGAVTYGTARNLARDTTASAIAPFTDFVKGLVKAKGVKYASQIMQDPAFQKQFTAAVTKNMLMAQNQSAMAKQLAQGKLGKVGPNE